MTRQLKNIATVRVKTDLEKPIDVDILAESIKSVADTFEKAISGGLTMRAICVLINDSMPTKEKVSVTDIWNVLIYASNLRKYITKIKP